jgi:hypothetical protein
MYWSPADFSGWFQLKGESRKISLAKSVVFFNFGFGGSGGLQPDSATSLGAPLQANLPRAFPWFFSNLPGPPTHLVFNWYRRHFILDVKRQGYVPPTTSCSYTFITPALRIHFLLFLHVLLLCVRACVCVCARARGDWPAADATDAPQAWGLLCNPVMNVIIFSPFFRLIEHRWNKTDLGKPKYLGKNLSSYHFVHHKSHMDWRRI